MKCSLTSIISLLFGVVIIHSVWNLVGIFRAPNCDGASICYKSFLNKKPSLDLVVYLTETSKSYDGNLILNLGNFNYEGSFEREVSISVPEKTRNNGSLFIHVLVLPSKNSNKNLRLNDAIYATNSVYLKKKLTRYTIPKSYTFNLLQDESRTQSGLPVAHLKGKFAIIMCTDELNIGQNNVPFEIARLMRINNNREFLPIVQQDFMQTRLKDLIEITPNNESMSFNFLYTPSSIGKLKFLVQIESTLTQFLTLGFTEKDMDEIKGVFADTNLWLLCATVCVGSIHLLFDFLSFKNDVSFWKSNISMAGLSTRTVLWRAFSQTVVFLFLMDEGTSLLVLIPSGIATLIEFWKVKKVLKATITWEGRPCIRFDKDKKETVFEAQTREFDEESMRYLSYVLYPLCVGAAVYSLIYQPHKSWYSWTINSLVNGIYAFGFLFMLPQLFVNYRLKSVAALPWRSFMYRAFNTFIDDIFAFIITMPTAHRVACFRDDIIFIIYLYQRWLYPVDKMRTEDVSGAVIEDKKIKKEKTN